MAVQENTATPLSPLNCLRNVALLVAAAIIIVYIIGVIVDNIPAIVSMAVASWEAILKALSLNGRSFWFPVAGATLSGAAVAWVACVFNSIPDKLATDDQTCNNFGLKALWAAVGVAGGVAFYAFFFAMRSVCDVTQLQTAHENIAYALLHVIAILPPGASSLLGLMIILFAADEVSKEGAK